MIAENMLVNFDEEAHRHLLLDSIIDVRKSSSTAGKEYAIIKSSNGTNRRAETTKGWEISHQCKDGCATWRNSRMLKTHVQSS